MSSRILGFNMQPKKQLFISLTGIYGVGIPLAMKACKECGVDPYIRYEDVPYSCISAISDYIKDNIMIGDDLKKVIYGRRKRLMDINSYTGKRIKAKLPRRGQRTRSNSRTVRKFGIS